MKSGKENLVTPVPPQERLVMLCPAFALGTLSGCGRIAFRPIRIVAAARPAGKFHGDGRSRREYNVAADCVCHQGDLSDYLAAGAASTAAFLIA
jgi:hypothetical protein